MRAGSSRRPRRWAWSALPLFLAVVLMVIALVSSPDGNGSLIDPHSLVSLGRMQHLLARVPQHGLVLGRPSARVTVAEYTDLQCAACALYSLALFPQIVSRYVEPGKVKLVLGVLSFIGPDSVLAGRAAIAASYQGKLWELHRCLLLSAGGVQLRIRERCIPAPSRRSGARLGSRADDARPAFAGNRGCTRDCDSNCDSSRSAGRAKLHRNRREASAHAGPGSGWA